jgi:chemotaxis protein methyltransferase CheR
MNNTLISIDDFKIISEYILRICGIYLPYEKEYLIRQRFIFLLEKFNLKDYNQLANLIKSGLVSSMQREMLISAITTSETYFFRDNHLFETLKENFLPKIISKIENQLLSKNSNSKINIWSAAASTGQEAYSIAIMIDEFVKSANFPNLFFNQFQIFATDIDNISIDYAHKGTYTNAEVNRGLKSATIEKYFIFAEGKWKIKDEIKKIISFSKISLHENYAFQRFSQKFDLIFARNVLIYFDDKTKLYILNQFHKLLNIDGFLILGATENLYGMQTNFESVSFGNIILYKPIY